MDNGGTHPGTRATGSTDNWEMQALFMPQNEGREMGETEIHFMLNAFRDERTHVLGAGGASLGGPGGR
eukprot:15466903-Alexandrium_andersonii.AAC.1